MAELSDTALMVVDLVNDFCHPDGFVARRGEDTSAARAIMPVVKELIAGARRVGVRVIYIRTEQSESTNSPAWQGRPTVTRAAASGLGHVPASQKDTWGAELYELEPRDDEPVIVKYRYSAFLHTSLELTLRGLGARTLLWTGTQTNVCVITNATDALMRDFEVGLIRDATATSSAAVQESAEREFADHVGPVYTAADVIQAWLSGRPHPEPAAAAPEIGPSA